MIEPLVQVLYTQKPISNIKCFRNHQMNLYYDLYCPLQKKWRGWICIEEGKRKRFTDNSSIIEALIKYRSRKKESYGIFPLDWASLPLPPIWNLTWGIWKVLSGLTNNQDLKVWRRVTFAFVEKWGDKFILRAPSILSILSIWGYVSLTLVNFPPCDFDHFTPYFGQLSPLRLTLLPPVKWPLSPFPKYQKTQLWKVKVVEIMHAGNKKTANKSVACQNSDRKVANRECLPRRWKLSYLAVENLRPNKSSSEKDMRHTFQP